MRLALQGVLPIVCHYKLLSEYRDVLARMAGGGELAFSIHQIERILGSLVTVAEEVDVRYLWRPNVRDEADNFVFEVAVAASPTTIVTHNVRDFERREIQFDDVLVRTPQEVLKEVTGHA